LVEQALPQAPQLAGVESDVSQPSVCLFELQSPQPEAQVPLQTPLLLHMGWMWLVEQVTPQPPQFEVVVSDASQPSVCLFELQSPQPEAQVPLQTPPLQAAVTWFVEQTTLAAPQFCGSTAVSVTRMMLPALS
jgi:hypothetical protein